LHSPVIIMRDTSISPKKTMAKPPPDRKIGIREYSPTLSSRHIGCKLTDKPCGRMTEDCQEIRQSISSCLFLAFSSSIDMFVGVKLFYCNTVPSGLTPAFRRQGRALCGSTQPKLPQSVRAETFVETTPRGLARLQRYC
jgi:hypothetical protein